MSTTEFEPDSRVYMAEKEWCSGPDGRRTKCYYCSRVEAGSVDYLPPSVDRRDCIAGKHWCSGPEGLRAVCDECEQARDDR